MAAVNDVLRLFYWIINPGDSTGIKNYLQATKERDKETDKLDISVSNSKDIVNHFLILALKNVLGRLKFMVGSDTGTEKIFRVVE